MKLILKNILHTIGRKWCVVDWSRWNAKEKCVLEGFIVDVDDVRKVVVDVKGILVEWKVYNL